MATEDAEFLEPLLCHHAEDPSMFFMKGMEALIKVAEETLYDESKGCTKEFTTLRSMLKLLVCKARYGLSYAGFDAFLSIIADMLPKDNKVPANTYYTKKLISPLTMGVEKINACRNHCILYQGANYKDLIAVQIVVQVGTRRIKITERKSVLPPCVKERSKRGPNRRPRRVVQNPLAKKNKK
jgi:hypothetical protein